jgi:hypothetical protein
METVSEVGKVLPPGRKALAEDAPSGNQGMNLVENRDLVTAFLGTAQQDRFYDVGGRGVKALGFKQNQGGQFPGGMSRYEEAIKNDDRYRLGAGEMAFQWMGQENDVDLARDLDLRGPGSMGMGAYDNHLPVQTTLAGVPFIGGMTREKINGLATDEQKKFAWQAAASAIESRIRNIGIVVNMDSKQSDNGRTVGIVGGPKTYKNVWKATYFPGDMMAWRVLPPSELRLCQLPEDEHQGNFKLVPVPVKWVEHDLSYQPTWVLFIPGILPRLINGVDHQYGTKPEADLVPLNRYQKVWYHRYITRALDELAAAGTTPRDVMAGAGGGWPEVHRRIRAYIAAHANYSPADWQLTVVRDCLGSREITIMHDQTIFGRNERYAAPRDQSLVLPLL